MRSSQRKDLNLKCAFVLGLFRTYPRIAERPKKGSIAKNCLESSGNGAVTERPCPFTLDAWLSQRLDVVSVILISVISLMEIEKCYIGPLNGLGFLVVM